MQYPQCQTPICASASRAARELRQAARLWREIGAPLRAEALERELVA